MPKRILLADDSITIQKVVELTFSDGDYEVTAVNNGARAIARLGEMRPDIILSDIIMPEKNGYEVCEYVKSHPEYRNIPVVLLTGTFEPFDPDRAEKAGCDAVVTKPFESQSLIHKVEELIANAQSSSPAPAPANDSEPEPTVEAPVPAPPPPPSPSASPWLDDEPAVTETGPSPFTTASGSFPTAAPPPPDDSFEHDSAIFGASAASQSAMEMPFEAPPAEPPLGGDTRAFPAVTLDDDFQQAAPAAPPEPSPWDEQDFGGETKAFGKLTFDDLQSMQTPTEPQHPSTTPAPDTDSPFGAPPPAEDFSAETRAFERVSFDDLQRQMSMPAPESEPEPQAEPERDDPQPDPQVAAPEPSPWDEPAETPFGGTETPEFPKMSFDDFATPAAEPQAETSPWDEQPSAFAGETRAFPKMSFEELSAAAPTPEPEYDETTPLTPLSSEPEAAPWEEPSLESEPAEAAEPPQEFSTAAYAPYAPPAEEPSAPQHDATLDLISDDLGSGYEQAAASEPEPEPEPEELPTVAAPEEPAWSPIGAAEAAAEPSEPAVPSAALAPETPSIPIRSSDLTDEQVDRIARRVVELMSDRVVRNIAWEVIPDLAEMVVKERIRQLESEA